MRIQNYFVAFLTYAILFANSLQGVNAQNYEVKIPIDYAGDGGRTFRDYVKVPVVKAKGAMQVKVGHIARDRSLIPSRAFSGALKQDEKSNQFRISWQSSGVGFNFKATVLYNRRAKTIKYFISGERYSGDFYRKYYVKYLLSNVTDKMIHQLATSNKDETDSSGPLGPLDVETAGFTKYITRYGARIVSSEGRSRKK